MAHELIVVTPELLDEMQKIIEPHLRELHRMWLEDGPAAMAAFEKTGANLDMIGGNCPVQAEGNVDGKRFYFRARGDSWQFHIADTDAEIFNDPLFYIEQPYGTWPDAGWMPQAVAIGFIVLAIETYRHRRDEMTAATKMREQQDRVRRAAESLIELIHECGPSFETRLATMRVDEAVMWTHRHITDQFDRRQLERKIEMDLFDRIAAAIAAKSAGNNAGYDEHLTALDSEVAALKGTEAGDATNISNIEAGLSKIADAVNPTPSAAPADPAPTDTSAAATPQSTADAQHATAAGTAQASGDATADAGPASSGSVDTTATDTASPDEAPAPDPAPASDTSGDAAAQGTGQQS